MSSHGGGRAADHTVVLDIGKTHCKLSLWSPDGALIERLVRSNQALAVQGYLALDVEGIEAWLAQALATLARRAHIAAIIPIAHGAAFAVIRDGSLLFAPMDYESSIPFPERARYDSQRDPFEVTGSPALPAGLNAGVQLHLLERLFPGALRAGATILPWAQFWSWRLSGVAAAEITSLGCHTDLWCPRESRASPMAVRRGWAALFPPLRQAGEILGGLSAEWSTRTGLSGAVQIYCGLHDSNAALLASQGLPELQGGESTILSTGTWFIGMRTCSTLPDLSLLPGDRDCLVNVDAWGNPVPSARFMGGREVEILTGSGKSRIDDPAVQQLIDGALTSVARKGAQLLPTFAPGCGPYPHCSGHWVHEPPDESHRLAWISLYVALVTDAALELIGARQRIVIEGRFANALGFARALAKLRSDTTVFIADRAIDASYGALRLVNPSRSIHAPLTPVAPLEFDLDAIRGEWRAAAEALSGDRPR